VPCLNGVSAVFAAYRDSSVSSVQRGTHDLLCTAVRLTRVLAVSVIITTWLTVTVTPGFVSVSTTLQDRSASTVSLDSTATHASDEQVYTGHYFIE